MKISPSTYRFRRGIRRLITNVDINITSFWWFRRSDGHVEAAAQRGRTVPERSAHLVVRGMDRPGRSGVVHTAIVGVPVVLVVDVDRGRHGHATQRDVGVQRTPTAAAGRPYGAPALGRRWRRRRRLAETVQLHATPAAASADPSPAGPPPPRVRTERRSHQGEAHDVQQSHTGELRVVFHHVRVNRIV